MNTSGSAVKIVILHHLPTALQLELQTEQITIKIQFVIISILIAFGVNLKLIELSSLNFITVLASFTLRLRISIKILRIL